MNFARSALATVVSVCAAILLLVGPASAESGELPPPRATEVKAEVEELTGAVCPAVAARDIVCVRTREVPVTYGTGRDEPGAAAPLSAGEVAPQRYPSYCTKEQNWVVRRFGACAKNLLSMWVHVEIDSKGKSKIVGTVSTMTNNYYSTTKILTVTHSWTTWISVAGTGTYSHYPLRMTTKDRMCGSLTTGKFNLSPSKSVVKEKVATCNVPNSTAAKPTFNYEFLVHPKGTTATIPQKWSAPTIRCDRATYLQFKYACVFSGYRPTWQVDIDDDKGAKTAGHIRSAMNSLEDHWGKQGVGSPLSRYHYTGSGTNPNRKVACAGFKKKDSSDSCDEYPMASTYQGAYFVGKSRTSVAHVPLTDNSYNGNLLNDFYRNNRILDGDEFWVKVS